jgi:DNA-binding CsgD family transcriptional regulator
VRFTPPSPSRRARRNKRDVRCWGAEHDRSIRRKSALRWDVGFGPQVLVRDFISGIFMLMEDQYGVGDGQGISARRRPRRACWCGSGRPLWPAGHGPGRAGAAAARGVPLACLARLLRSFDARPGTPARPALVEPLTARELEVLGLLAAGRPNQGIAEELVVTVDTVKKHVGHVLDKLGAANRTEAVARARELGLL